MRLAAAVAIAWLSLAPASVFAQQPPAVPKTRAPLSARMATSTAERLIESPRSDDRIRGIARLSSLGTREAVDRIVRAMQSGSPVAGDPRAKLAAVRAIFPSASREPVRQVLGKELTAEGAPDPLAEMTRDTAALALAASDDAKCIELLVAAVRRGTAGAQAAERALLAYPPKVFSAIVAPGKPGDVLPANICALLGKLGDLRAIGPLRASFSAAVTGLDVQGQTPAKAAPGPERKSSAVAAALTLVRLGDQAHLYVVRQWTQSRDPEMRAAAAAILVESGAADRGLLLSGWMRAEDTRAKAVELSLRMPSADLVGGLVEVARAGHPDLVGKSLAALGRIGDEGADRALAQMLSDPARAWGAAFALANSPGSRARAELESALADSRTRRLAARAGIARVLVRDDPPRRLVGVLSELRGSRDEADRAVGAFGLAVLGEATVRSLLASGDVVVLRAAARASLFVGGDAASACAERLAGEADEITRAALGIALAASPHAADPVSTATLAEWAESGGPIAPLAALSLGRRDGATEKERLDRLLTNADPAVRSHTAFGLGYSQEPDSSSRLAQAWHFETDAGVRRAIVAALSWRSEPQRIEVLDLASRLDPDARVREVARLGLQRRLTSILQRESRSGHVAWITLSPNDAAAAPMLRARTGRLAEASGLVLPVVTDPDGALVVPGIAPGPASFALAL